MPQLCFSFYIFMRFYAFKEQSQQIDYKTIIFSLKVKIRRNLTALNYFIYCTSKNEYEIAVTAEYHQIQNLADVWRIAKEKTRSDRI